MVVQPWAENETLTVKQPKAKVAGGMAQVIDHLPSKPQYCFC
jgi:hypothetical protein